MCGVVALLAVQSQPIDCAALARAAGTISHRGPDDEGYVLCGVGIEGRPLGGDDTVPLGLPDIRDARTRAGDIVGLAHRRLAIIDTSAAGHGPMGSRDGLVWLSYNGEIYNYRELTRDLEAHGYRFESRTDTEVVLAAYLTWGTDCFRRLNGMWGLAIWDGRTGEMLLSRDRLGIKPLYVSDMPDMIAAASEPAALLALGADRGVNWDVAFAYLVAGYADWGAVTFFRGIRQVEPGTVEIIRSDGARRAERFWSLDDAPAFTGTPAQAADEVRRLLLDSVRLQLRSDVPVGTCLSGGLDSSGIACAIALSRGDDDAQHAFTCSFPGSWADESRYAGEVAQMADLEWHTVTPRGDDLVSDIDRLVRAQGEPFPSSSSYAQFRVMGLAADAGVAVLLDGQGGDELFAGYTGFVAPAVADLVRSGKLMPAARELWAARHAASPVGVAARMLVNLVADGPGAAMRARTRRRSQDLLTGDAHRSHGSVMGEIEQGGRTLADALRRALLRTTLPVLLRSEDRNSMTHSVEARVPFLDHRLVEFAATLPGTMKLSGGRYKAVLRDAISEMLPPAVAARTDKMGFVTPEAEWLAGPAAVLVEDTLAGLAPDGAVDRAAVERAWSALRGGDLRGAPQLWRVVCFERWRRAAAG